MIELLACVGGLAVVAGLAIAPWTLLVQAGALLAGIGLVLGLPTGFAYHVQLRRELERCDMLPARWWLQPTAHHVLLDESGRHAIRAMFHLGAGGFAVVSLGCIMVVAGLIRSASSTIAS